jgi:amino acid transporter
MGQHRQLPEAIRHVHPRFNTPYVAIVLYSVIAIFLMIPPGRRRSSATCTRSARCSRSRSRTHP